MTQLLAQADMGGVPAATFKWVFIILIGLAVAAAFIWAAIRPDRKQSVRIDREDQPVETRIKAKRYNHDLAEERHAVLSQRLSLAEENIRLIQESRVKSVQRIERRFNKIWIVLTKIATKMNIETEDDLEETTL